ncbi:MAG TPA: phosphatase domain-containing protein [Chitinophagaceae bacterium]|nr:phosphatase domain-containing protein [Chitinophagaceae bacterium]
MQTTQTIIARKNQSNWWHNAWSAVLRWLRLTNDITVKVYHGYGQPGRYVVYGHVLTLGPLQRTRFSGNFWKNTVALLRLFIVRPYAGAHVQLRWEGEILKTVTEDDGFFKIEWKTNRHLPPGWHPIQVEMTGGQGEIIATGTGYIFIPYPTQLGFISDIDDTFLISHSANLRKRLYVLFTRNARSRKPFEGVVRHYQALTLGRTTEAAPNPFFYVSSSEWNLFNYILEFTRVNGLPKGVFLLSQLKRFSQIFKTGQNKHATKFMRIVRILEHYPEQRFVLLGDSSQQDPDIYAAVVKHFPQQVHAVYIRDVYRKNKEKAAKTLDVIEAAGVPCCFFEHSSEALEHSRRIGLI